MLTQSEPAGDAVNDTAFSIAVREMALALSELVQGNLLHRIVTPFPDQYDEMRLNYNRASEQVLQGMKRFIALSSIIRNGARDLDGAISEVTWRNALQSAALQTAMQAVAPVREEAGDKSAELAQRSQAMVDDAHAQIRRLLPYAPADVAGQEDVVMHERNAAMASFMADRAAVSQHRYDQLEAALVAMGEMREIMEDYTDTVKSAHDASSKLTKSADDLVDTVCDFNISEAAARAAWGGSK